MSPILGVVIPAYNEGRWVLRAVDALRIAAERAEWPLQVVIVDDGSTDPESLRILDEVGLRDDVRVTHQPNSGRFAARATGLAEIQAEHVLLLDARVEVAPHSLLTIRQEMAGGKEVWNYDVTPASRHLGALFWTGITKVWWRDYFRSRRPVSFGIEDFNRFPKGTTAFLAPTRVVRDAIGDFDSHFADRALASDDTRLLRSVAGVCDINLSPSVMCRHHAKSGRGSFVRQCYYRGTTFVDGYLPEGADPSRLLQGAVLAVAVAGSIAVAAPRGTLAVSAAGCVTAGSVTRWSGGTALESAAVALMSPVFGLTFGAGLVRGLRLAARSRG